MLAYRTTVSDRAVQLLAYQASGVGDRALAVRAMVQMIHATALDALLQDQGPLRASRTKMVETMTAMLVRSLGLSGTVAAAEEEKEPSSGSPDEDDPPIEMPIEEVVAYALPASQSKPRSRKPRRKVAIAEPPGELVDPIEYRRPNRPGRPSCN